MGLLDLVMPWQRGPALHATRAAESATSPIVPVVYAERYTGVLDRGAATPEQIRTALRGTVSLAARIRAHAVADAMLFARVQRRGRDGAWTDVEDVHPWRALLRNPCPALPALTFWRLVQMQKDLGRGAFLYTERDSRGVPVALWPIYPAWGDVRPVLDGMGRVDRFVMHRTDGRRVELAAEDVVWLRHPHPLSPGETASLLMAAAFEADVDRAEKIYRRDSVKGSGAARIQITTEQSLTADQMKRLGDEAKAKLFGGRDTVPVFGEGSEAKPLGLTAEDMEFIEGAKMNRTELLQIFGIPEGLLSDKANRANALAARFAFADLTVQPEVNEVCGQLTADLQQAFRASLDLRVAAPEVVPLDPEQAMREAESELRTGQVTLNERRRALGRDEYGPWADVPLVSAALVPAESVAAQASPREPSTPPARHARAARTDEDDEAEAAWREIERRRTGPMAAVRDAAESVLSAMQRDVVVRLTNARGIRQDVPSGLRVDDVFDVAAWLDVLEEELGGPLIAAIRAGFEAGAFNASYDGAFDASTDAVRDALAQVVEKTRTVPDTVKGVLETALRDGVDAGDDVAALTRRIGEVFDGLRTWEAERIAVTSANAAFEAGQQHAFSEAGITRHRWLTQRDGAVRASHGRSDGQVRDVGERFACGLRYPHDPDGPASEVVNCRCTVLPVLE